MSPATALAWLGVSKPDISGFCGRWNVETLELFGSALRPDFGPGSDVDLLVAFAPGTKWSLFELYDMEREFEAIFGRRVDLVERKAVEKSRNRIRRDGILRDAARRFADASHRRARTIDWFANARRRFARAAHRFAEAAHRRIDATDRFSRTTNRWADTTKW